jgi:rhamnosyltransferase
MPLVPPGSKKKVDVTVFIPTFNGEKYLERLLSALESQDFSGSFEILVIDSGSSDQTLEIISQHPFVRLVDIDQSEFGHGKTRNLAAKLARGTYIAYLSHDAIPVGSQWLAELISPLNPAGLDCVGVVGKHFARMNCPPLLKYEINGVFDACGPDSGITIVDGSTKSVESMSTGELFYSDVNSATRTDFLLNTISYRDVDYSEDLAFAKDFLSAGNKKAYVPSAVVEHSNDVTLSEYGKRVFDETLGMRKVGEGRNSISWVQAKARAIRDVLKTSWLIIRDKDYSVAEKLRWLMVNPVYVWKKWANIHRALNVNLSDTQRIERYSLEAHRTNNA